MPLWSTPLCSVRRLCLAFPKSLPMANTSLLKGRALMTRGLHYSRILNQELTCRLARSNDFDDILTLSEGIYNGHDYVPVRFQTWMKMENSAVMLSYADKKPAGLLVCTVVDEGRSFVSRAARVSPEFRGQGVHKMQGKAMEEFVLKKFPNVRRKLLTKYDENFPLGRKLVQLDNLTCYVEKATLPSHQIPVAKSSVEVISCPKEYLHNVIFSRKTTQKLFPDNVIILDWLPIEPLGSNIDYLMQEHDMYFAVEKCADGTQSPRSVSFGVLSHRISKLVHWCAAVYSSEKVLYEAHLVHQFKKACEVVNGDFIFSCSQDKQFTDCGRRMFKEQLQMTLDEESETVNLYEFNFP